ncbi:Uncharacterised protein [Pseudomonas aeruginosa]|nr:Uncharacterised protein [Pseudomonas aeruginosa]
MTTRRETCVHVRDTLSAATAAGGRIRPPGLRLPVAGVAARALRRAVQWLALHRAGRFPAALPRRGHSRQAGAGDDPRRGRLAAHLGRLGEGDVAVLPHRPFRRAGLRPDRAGARHRLLRRAHGGDPRPVARPPGDRQGFDRRQLPGRLHRLELRPGPAAAGGAAGADRPGRLPDAQGAVDDRRGGAARLDPGDAAVDAARADRPGHQGSLRRAGADQAGRGRPLLRPEPPPGQPQGHDGDLPRAAEGQPRGTRQLRRTHRPDRRADPADVGANATAGSRRSTYRCGNATWRGSR